MKPIGILALVIMAIGFAFVYGANVIAKKLNLAKRQKCEHASQMTEEEIENYKNNKAVFNVKLLGLLISVPGLVLFIVFNR